MREASKTRRRVRLAVVGLSFLVGLGPGSAAAQEFTFGSDLPAVRRAIFAGLANGVGSLPTPGGGAFTYQFEPALGVFTRTTDSLGPVFADRAETTGRGRVTLSFSYTRHTFDEIDGVHLRNGELLGLFAAGTVLVPGTAAIFRANVLSIREEVRADVFTLGALYGVTDRLDLGLTLPIINARIEERIRRLGFADCVAIVTDLFCGPAVATGESLRPSVGENTGVGDIVLRSKYHFWRSGAVMGGRLGAAAGLDVKLPTGDRGDRRRIKEPELSPGVEAPVSASRFTIGDPPLGTGIVRVKPNLIASGSWFGVSPHINVGAELGKTEGITNDLVYAVGLEYAPLPWVTFAVDFLGRHAFDVDRPRVTRLGASLTETGNPDTFTGSFGVKVNPVGTLLLYLNFLVSLNNTGVRDDVTPTFGLEWSF